MDETPVSPLSPNGQPKKSRLGCVIAGVAAVGCMVVLLIVAVVAFFVLRGSRSSGGLLPSPEATPAVEASPDFPSDLGTPPGEQVSEEAGEATSPPLVATPVTSGSLDEMLESVGNEPQMANSRTDPTLRRDILRQIITGLGASGCRLSVHGTRVAHGPDADGAWGEVWDLSLCDRRRVLKIGLTPSPGGGTDFTVTE